jgi:hypothetical protein
MTSLRPLLLVALALGLTACAHLPSRDGAKAGPFFTPANVKVSPDGLPANIRRVLLLPVSAEGLGLPDENLARIDAAFLTELNRAARFEVVTLSRDELVRLAGVRQLNSTAAMPPAFLDHVFNVYNDYGADAVLFVDLTAYSAYPPLLIGVRAKLASVHESDIPWAADISFSAADPAVANAARRHALSIAPQGPVDLSHTILQNPARFAGYVAEATFATLPTRAAPPAAPAK